MSYYTLELEEPRCESCGKGEGWTIVDSKGTGNGVTYYDKDGAQEVCAELNEAFECGAASVKPLLLELFLAGREDVDAQAEAALLTPNSDYDECEASKARCLAAERRLEAAEAAVEFLLAVELGQHYAEETAVRRARARHGDGRRGGEVSDERDDERSEPPALEDERYRWTDGKGLLWSVNGNGRFHTFAEPQGWAESVVAGLGPLLLIIHCQQLAAELAACRARGDEDDGEAWRLLGEAERMLLVLSMPGSYSRELSREIHEYLSARRATATATPADEETER